MENEIQNLVLKANELYRLGIPTGFSDEEYDALVEKFFDENPNHPFFSSVGSEPTLRTKIQHRHFMGSLNKVNSIQELKEWISKNYPNFEKIHWKAPCKVDGVSVSLKFVNGNFIQAATRGNGTVGEDITIKFQKRIGKFQNFSGFIFGEAFIFQEVHEANFPNNSNSRNTVAGLVRTDDNSNAEFINIFPFSAKDSDGNPISLQDLKIHFIENKIFAFQDFSLSYSELISFVERYIDKNQREIGLDPNRNFVALTDGLVIGPYNEILSEELGITSGKPVGKIALKLPSEKGISTIKSVSWNTGRTGRVTPVAHFEPVGIGGVSVSNASLHNESYIKELGGIAIGDTVLISRRGDVIPYVEKVVSRKASPQNEIPKDCPSCGSDLQKSGEYIVCQNVVECPAQVEGRIQHYLNYLEVKGYGETLVNALVENGVKFPHQIYEFQNLQDLEVNGRRVGGLGENAESSLRERSSGVPLARLLGSLGVPMWGERLFQSLIDGAGIDSFDCFESMTSFPEGIEGIGPKRLEVLNQYREQITKEASTLIRSGYVTISKPSETEKIEGILSGQVYLFTGFRDKELEKRILELGGEVAKSYSKAVTHVISLDKSEETGKIKKAQKDGKAILSRHEFNP